MTTEYFDENQAVLTPKQLRWWNKELEPEGKRICRTHLGAALPLTDKYFYRTRRFSTQYSTQCKKCHAEASRVRKNERYHSDPEFRQRRLAVDAQSRHRTHAHRLEVQRAYERRRKAVRLQQVIARRLAEKGE